MTTPTKYTLEDLETLMARLRDPEIGCPWDLKQSWDSIVPHTLEEIYEVVEAIENKDFDHVREELGDILFHIVFYCQFAKEEQKFLLEDVIHGVVEKLLRRHPHVFPEGTLESQRNPNEVMSDEAINQAWDRIKKEEKRLKPQRQVASSRLDEVPRTFPALQYSEKVQRIAAKSGFDWDHPEPVIAQIKSEIEELQQAMVSGDVHDIQDELGDVLFSVVNLSRKLKLNPETALRHSSHKFTSRFKQMEQLASDQNSDFDALSMAEKEKLWKQAKVLLSQ